MVWACSYPGARTGGCKTLRSEVMGQTNFSKFKKGGGVDGAGPDSGKGNSDSMTAN